MLLLGLAAESTSGQRNSGGKAGGQPAESLQGEGKHFPFHRVALRNLMLESDSGCEFW